ASPQKRRPDYTPGPGVETKNRSSILTRAAVRAGSVLLLTVGAALRSLRLDGGEYRRQLRFLCRGEHIVDLPLQLAFALDPVRRAGLRVLQSGRVVGIARI